MGWLCLDSSVGGREGRRERWRECDGGSLT